MNKNWTLHIEGSGPIDDNTLKSAIEEFTSKVRSKNHDIKNGTFTVNEKTEDVSRSYATR